MTLTTRQAEVLRVLSRAMNWKYASELRDKLALTASPVNTILSLEQKGFITTRFRERVLDVKWCGWGITGTGRAALAEHEAAQKRKRTAN